MRHAALLLGGVLAVLLGAASARAHGLAPLGLELREQGPGRYAATWSRPAEDAAPTPVFPAGCSPGPATVDERQQRRHERFVVDCGALRLAGQRIGFTGLARGDQVIVRLVSQAGPEQVLVAHPARPEVQLPSAAAGAGDVGSFVLSGMAHIWGGADHLLYVLGLFLLVSGLRSLLWTLSAFTLAHSLTLALSVLDLVRLPGAAVEATIALSIALVALEVVQRERGQTSSLGARAPWLPALAFGLLHGFGFAGALTEAGLPRESLGAALLGFNLGVELGQVLFVAALAALGWWARLLLRSPAQRSLGVNLLAHAMGSLAVFWCLERVSAFWA